MSESASPNILSVPVVPVKPVPRPVLPAYSWRAKSAHAKLFYVRDHLEANAIVSKLGSGPLGFDLEWKPNFVKGQPENPVAVVQLSSEDTIVLFQVIAMKGASFQSSSLLD